MKTFVGIMISICLLSGCCSVESREAVAKAQSAMEMTQSYYHTLVGHLVIDPFSPELKAAAIAADSALSLASVIHKSWCPKVEEAQQALLQAQEAKKKADRAGVKP